MARERKGKHRTTAAFLFLVNVYLIFLSPLSFLLLFWFHLSPFLFSIFLSSHFHCFFLFCPYIFHRLRAAPPPPSPFDGGGRKDARLRTIFFSLEVFFLSPCSSSLSFFLDLDHFFSRDCMAALSRSVFLFFLFIFIAESRSVDDGNVKA
jgi:hypothetical protein